MDKNFIEIEINGTIYYVEANRFADLAFIDNKLVNVSNSNITLVTSYSDQLTYPYISCQANRACLYRSSYNSNYSFVTSQPLIRSKFNFNTLQTNGLLTIIFFCLFILLGARLLWKR